MPQVAVARRRLKMKSVIIQWVKEFSCQKHRETLSLGLPIQKHRNKTKYFIFKLKIFKT